MLTSKDKMKWYCDASTFKNGQVGQDSTVVIVKPDKTILKEHLGDFTVNYAELYAVKKACQLAEACDEIFTYSIVTYGWIKKFKKNKANGYLETLVQETQEIVKNKGLRVEWIPREENDAGHYFTFNPVYPDTHAQRLEAWKKKMVDLLVRK